VTGGVVLVALGSVPLTYVVCLLWAGARSLRMVRAARETDLYLTRRRPAPADGVLYLGYDGVGGYDGGDYGIRGGEPEDSAHDEGDRVSHADGGEYGRGGLDW